MLYVIETNDKPDGFDLRLKTRPAHMEFLKSLGDGLVLAGPFQDEQGRSNGSLVVIRAENQAQAETIAARDPYAIAGLFASTSVRPWVWSINKPERV